MTRGNGETAIVLAVQRSESVRTTVPKHVAKKLGLEPGIHVVWDIDKVDGEWIETIRKVTDDGA